MKITRCGSQPSAVGPEEWFMGRVRMDPLFAVTPPSRVAGNVATFEPGARTAWHTHPLGQILIVTSGVGRIQRRGDLIEEIRAGDVVWIGPDEIHWHGASPTVAMSHIGLQEWQNGTAAYWLEQVSDEDYDGPVKQD
ncbi:cupin domain-containing protein [Rhizobium sp. 2MFCol3.1]|uniref:(R)-mandelonitrile lyase n=1 Tax=Rhizobium sp. 2MFCol3.1 TaxID=1246459 RepID=UPI0004764A83|nr:cupin domain-containing protein [Rhizobium sp. 2MFCol3.1]